MTEEEYRAEVAKLNALLDKPIHRYAHVTPGFCKSPGIWAPTVVTRIDGGKASTRPARAKELLESYWWERGYKTVGTQDLDKVDRAYLRIAEIRNQFAQKILSELREREPEQTVSLSTWKKGAGR